MNNPKFNHNILWKRHEKLLYNPKFLSSFVNFSVSLSSKTLSCQQFSLIRKVSPEAMERLLYSSSPTHLQFSPLKPRLAPFCSPKLGFFPLSRPDYKRFTSVACRNENSSQFFYSSSSKLNSLKSISPRVDSPNDAIPNSTSLKQIATSAVEQKKVCSSWKRKCFYLIYSFFESGFVELCVFVVN